MLPESSEPQGTAQTAGAAGWEWETASGEEGMAGALAAARGGARDGHKLGDCLAHFCAPCAPCRPLTRAAPSLAGLSQFSVLAVLPSPAFVLAGCRLSLLGTAGTSPPIHCTSQTCWQTQHQQPEKPLAGISGHTSGAWFLQKRCKMHRKTLKLPNPCEAADLTCPPHCPVLPAGFQSGMESRASPQGWSSSGLLGEAPWGAGGNREPPFPVGTCPTWWWGTSSCARSARRRRRRRSRTGGCACREGGRCWEWPIGIS